MRTAVATVPDATVVLAIPLASVRPILLLMLIPPAVLSRENSTSWFGTGPPVEFDTRKETLDCSTIAPDPFSPIMLGSAAEKVI